MTGPVPRSRPGAWARRSLILLWRHWCWCVSIPLATLHLYARSKPTRAPPVRPLVLNRDSMRTRRPGAMSLPTSRSQGWRPPSAVWVRPPPGAGEIPLPDTLAFSIPEFCRRHGISRAHFYNLSRSGDGPALMRVGRRTLISAEAAAEWRRRMEQVDRDAVADARRAGS